MSFNNSTSNGVNIGQPRYNVKTQENKLLRVQGSTVTADEGPWNFEHADAQFYVDEGVLPDTLLYRFRPVGQPNKYLAFSGSGIIVLQNAPSASADYFSHPSYNFIPGQENEDYMKFQVRSSGNSAPMYLRTAPNYYVIVAVDSAPEERAWFRLQEVDSHAITFPDSAILLGNSQVDGHVPSAVFTMESTKTFIFGIGDQYLVGTNL